MRHYREAIELLERAAKQFRFYEQVHRDKAEQTTFPDAIDAALAKADCNAKLAHRIEEFLSAD